MLDQDQTEATDIAQLPRNKDGSIRKTFVKSVARRIDSDDASGLRGLVGDLHEADMGALIEALEQEQRPRLVALLGIDFDFTALTEVDDAVRDEILDELPSQAVAKGVSELESDDAVAILEDLPKDEQAIYDFADEFLRTHAVSDATLNAARSVLGGDRGIVDLVGTMGLYQISSMMVALDKTPLPQGVRPYFE